MIDEAVVSLDEVGAGAPAWSLAMLPVRLAEIGAAGALVAVLMVLLWLGPRPDLATAPGQPFFWVKAVYTGGLALAGLQLVASLTRRRGTGALALAAGGVLVAVMLIAAATQAGRLEPALLTRLFRPFVIWNCLFNIVSLVAPMLVVTVLGLRGLDLERPAAVGFAAGLFCGGVAATILSLHCPHATFVFVGLWYTVAIALCGLAGAAALVIFRRVTRSIASERPILSVGE